MDRRRGRGVRLFVAVDDVDKARHLAGLLCAVFLVCTLECDRLVALRRVGRELEVELDHDRVAGRHIGDSLTVVGLLDHEWAFVEVRGNLRRDGDLGEVFAAVDERQREGDALTGVSARRCDVLPVLVDGNGRQRAEVARHARVRAVLGDIDVNRHGELHVLLNVRAVHLVVAPDGRPDRKVNGIDALFRRLRDGDGVFHIRAAVVGHIVQVADVADGGNIERPVADVLDGRRDGRLDGDVAQEIEVARQILAVHDQRHQDLGVLAGLCCGRRDTRVRDQKRVNIAGDDLVIVVRLYPGERSSRRAGRNGTGAGTFQYLHLRRNQNFPVVPVVVFIVVVRRHLEIEIVRASRGTGRNRNMKGHVQRFIVPDCSDIPVIGRSKHLAAGRKVRRGKRPLARLRKRLRLACLHAKLLQNALPNAGTHRKVHLHPVSGVCRRMVAVCLVAVEQQEIVPVHLDPAYVFASVPERRVDCQRHLAQARRGKQQQNQSSADSLNSHTFYLLTLWFVSSLIIFPSSR